MVSRVDGVRLEQARIAIGGASRAAGVDFDYLLAQARIESDLNPDAKAKTSSAAGLYQFTKSTWLGMLNRHGSAYGADWASQAIQKVGGRHVVQDPQLRQQILDLRYDPSLAAAMAAEFANENRAVLQPIVGREPDHAELYLAHFLGAGGAGKFLRALQSRPDQSAASLFPSAAQANRSIFYAKDGSARSVSAVMGLIRNKVEQAKLASGKPEDALQDDGFAQMAMAAKLSANPSDQRHALSKGPLAQEFESYASPSFRQAGQESGRRSMSSVLMEAFGQPTSVGNVSGTHISNAYGKFQGFGL